MCFSGFIVILCMILKNFNTTNKFDDELIDKQFVFI